MWLIIQYQINKSHTWVKWIDMRDKRRGRESGWGNIARRSAKIELALVTWTVMISVSEQGVTSNRLTEDS
jgi:hypothetical protein